MKYLRLLKLGLQTLLGIRRQGYFIPYRYADKVPSAPAKLCYAASATAMKKAERQFSAAIKRAAKHLRRFGTWKAGRESRGAPKPHFGQDWFPRLDGVMAYSMVAHHKPARIIEIGSGHSTRFLRQAVEDFNLPCRLVSVDPSPRAAIGKGTKHRADYLQNMPLSLFKPLRADDILFIDSSHILVPGSDVDFYLNGILPHLRSGVLVHIHDIFLPYDYPASWRWRGYNEQSGVATLLNGGGWKILWASAYAVKHCRKDLQKSGLLSLPMPKGAHESSLWLRKL